jgi:oxygen-independent coproporphyrinogen-3 oxidase
VSLIASPATAGTIALAALPPLSLYIHLPWCAKKCPYCDFNSHAARTAIPEARYIEALIADLDATLPFVWGRRVGTVFFGGGTPSLFSAGGIDAILAAVRARIALDPDAEITLEANPGTVDAERFRGYRAAGVNRLSLGIQSFDDRHLKALGRIHDSNEGRRAIGIARDHFDNINLDLMFALPDQSIDECASDIDMALSFGTTHLSMYHLTLEPNTLFHRFPPRLPDDDASADMQDMVIDRLTHAGFTHYETSAFAQPGRECRHNLNYWRFGDYLGIGAGAHGKLSAPDDGTGMRIVRTTKHKQPARYLASAASAARNLAVEPIDPAARPFEFMLNALRLAEGFEEGLFEARTGLPAACVAPACARLAAHGLLEQRGTGWAATPFGFERLNDLLLEFMPA